MCWPKYELKNHSMVSARVLLSMAHGLSVALLYYIYIYCGVLRNQLSKYND